MDEGKTHGAERCFYALDVVRQKEYVAGFILSQRFGCETFIPTETRWRKRNRYQKAKTEMAFAAEPGTIFVTFPGPVPWYEVMKLPLVTGFLGIGGEPARIFTDGDRGKQWRAYRAGQLNGYLVVGRKKRLHRGIEVDVPSSEIFVEGRGILRAPQEQRHMRSNREVHVGEEATIAEGPFRFVTVKVQKIVGERARVLLPLFGAEETASGGVLMTVPLSELEAVA